MLILTSLNLSPCNFLILPVLYSFIYLFPTRKRNLVHLRSQKQSRRNSEAFKSVKQYGQYYLLIFFSCYYSIHIKFKKGNSASIFWFICSVCLLSYCLSLPVFSLAHEASRSDWMDRERNRLSWSFLNPHRSSVMDETT